MPETHEEYRFEWTYPYLENKGMSHWSSAARDKNQCHPGDNDAFHNAGHIIRWQKRTVTTTAWEDDNDPTS
jgi:hypothetical protein